MSVTRGRFAVVFCSKTNTDEMVLIKEQPNDDSYKDTA